MKLRLAAKTTFRWIRRFTEELNHKNDSNNQQRDEWSCFKALLRRSRFLVQTSDSKLSFFVNLIGIRYCMFFLVCKLSIVNNLLLQAIFQKQSSHTKLKKTVKDLTKYLKALFAWYCWNLAQNNETKLTFRVLRVQAYRHKTFNIAFIQNRKQNFEGEFLYDNSSPQHLPFEQVGQWYYETTLSIVKNSFDCLGANTSTWKP